MTSGAMSVIGLELFTAFIIVSYLSISTTRELLKSILYIMLSLDLSVSKDIAVFDLIGRIQ
jgi:hypothetical protein